MEFSGQSFQQTLGIPIGTNCALLLVDLFLYRYEAEFIPDAQKNNFTYRYIDDVLSLNNSKISEILDLIYPCELEIKGMAESNNLHLPHT